MTVRKHYLSDSHLLNSLHETIRYKFNDFSFNFFYFFGFFVISKVANNRQNPNLFLYNVFELLLQNGANINISANNFRYIITGTPLHRAAMLGLYAFLNFGHFVC